MDPIQKYGLFDAEGWPKAFYSSEVNAEIPPEAVAISAEQWLEFLTNTGTRRWDGAGVVPYDGPPLLPQPAPLPVVTDPLDFWRRCTITEAETVNQVALTMPIRDQQVFARAKAFDHADPDTGRLKDMLTQAFGAARAAELLAPS
jgi:hypothetical protein